MPDALPTKQTNNMAHVSRVPLVFIKRSIIIGTINTIFDKISELSTKK
jgi:hypothetical protein